MELKLRALEAQKQSPVTCMMSPHGPFLVSTDPRPRSTRSDAVLRSYALDWLTKQPAGTCLVLPNEWQVIRLRALARTRKIIVRTKRRADAYGWNMWVVKQ